MLIIPTFCNYRFNGNNYRNFKIENLMRPTSKNYTDDYIRHKLYYSGLFDNSKHTVSIDDQKTRDTVYFSNGQVVQK